MKLGFRHIVPGGFAALALVLVLTTGCQTTPRAGAPLVRRGDEIMVAGQLFHTGTRVVLWTDPGGYDGYRVERRFAPLEKADWDSSHAAVKYLTTPNRYDRRRADLTEEEIEQVRGGGWDLPLLQRVVDQFVYHYDVCGTSRQCFKVLHDLRGLSVHFMLDLDGTIYQTVDLKERTWHATTSNTRSVGIEIANMGAYGNPAKSPLPEWYVRDADGRTRVTIPERFGDGGLLTKNFVGRPRLNEPVVGMVQGQQLTQYDFTPEQYAALVRSPRPSAGCSRKSPAIIRGMRTDNLSRAGCRTRCWRTTTACWGTCTFSRTKWTPAPHLTGITSWPNPGG